MVRPSGVGPDSGTQRPEIQAYCDGLNIADYNCRRISRILFIHKNVFPDNMEAVAWDSNHTGGLGDSDSDPPYSRSWGDARMVASPSVGGDFFYCMSLFFSPPIPSGWDMEFRWTVGSNPSGNDPTIAAAVDVQFGSGKAISRLVLRETKSGRFRENLEGGAAFLPWEDKSFPNSDSSISEVRWCAYATDTDGDTTYNRARLDGVLFGTDREEFCRPGLNAGNTRCRSGHDDFIDRYCVALDIPFPNCVRISRLAFTRRGVGEHVWDPTHGEASDDGGTSSVLSPPVRKDEYSCMSLYFEAPDLQGVEFHFDWALSRRAAYENESGRANAVMRFFLFAPGDGDDHDPMNFTDYKTDAFRTWRVGNSGFQGWDTKSIANSGNEFVPVVLSSTETITDGELKWCYYGGHVGVGEQDRGRLDALRFEGQPSYESTNSRVVIETYCTALNIGDALCTRVSSIGFLRSNSGELAWDPNHAMSAVPGDMLSVASQQVGLGDYSCMSLHFRDPLVAGSDISFRWAVGRGVGSGGNSSIMQVWFAPTGAQQPPVITFTQPFISEGQGEFSAWLEHSAVAIDRPVPELRWCYFGSNPSPGEMDIGRVDRLEVIEGGRIRFVLPNPRPAVDEGTDAAIVVRSEFAVEAGRTVSIRLLVEEGSRFLDPNGPNVVAEISTPGRLVLEYSLAGDGTTLEHVLMLPILDDDFAIPRGKVRLALAEPLPGARYRLGTPSSGFLIVIDDNDYRLDVDGPIRWWRLLRQCQEPSGCPTSVGPVPTLPNSPDLPMRTEDELRYISEAFQASLTDETLDVNGDEMNDTMDLRIILRYLAGLRGGALGESGTVNEARLQALAR